MDELLPLFLVGIVSGVYNEVVLPQNSCLFHVIFKHSFEVNLEPHKLPQGLLPDESLSLHVDLAYRFAWKTLGVKNATPLPYSELSEGQT